MRFPTDSYTDPQVPPVTVIVVNYNGGEMVCQCLEALRQQSFGDFSTIVVDNSSCDNSVASIRDLFPNVTIISLPANLGFAGGVNRALRETGLGTMIALLNPDAFPSTGWLENLVACAQRHPDYAAFGSRMFGDSNQCTLDGVGDAYHISGLPWRQGHGKSNTVVYDREVEIFAPCAAAALYRAEALQKVGGLDEDLFLYVEDIDLGFRMRLAGYRCLYVPFATVLHVGSAFVGKHSDLQIYHGHRNLVWVFVQNMPGLLFWAFLPVHIALNLVTLVWFTLRGKGPVIWRAKRDAWLGLPLAWKKRARIQAGRTASIWTILGQLSWNPFSRGP